MKLRRYLRCCFINIMYKKLPVQSISNGYAKDRCAFTCSTVSELIRRMRGDRWCGDYCGVASIVLLMILFEDVNSLSSFYTNLIFVETFSVPLLWFPVLFHHLRQGMNSQQIVSNFCLACEAVGNLHVYKAAKNWRYCIVGHLIEWHLQ